MKPEKENTTNSDLFDADATDENPKFQRSDENLADLCELTLEDLAVIQGGLEVGVSARAGSNDYVSFGSVFNITGDIHIQSTGNTLNVKITDVLLGTYNGE